MQDFALGFEVQLTWGEERLTCRRCRESVATALELHTKSVRHGWKHSGDSNLAEFRPRCGERLRL